MALNGMELMAKTLGMGEMMEAAKKIAESGVVEKLLVFAAGLDELKSKIQLMDDRLVQMEETQKDMLDALGRIIGRLPPAMDATAGRLGAGSLAGGDADDRHGERALTFGGVGGDAAQSMETD